MNPTDTTGGHRDDDGRAIETHTPPAPTEPGPPPPEQPQRMNVFERYLTVWVALCMVLGVVIGRTVPTWTETLRSLEFGTGSQINIPIAVLIWLMIVPMMMRIDFTSLIGVSRRPRGLLITILINWVVKPLSLFVLGWLFFQVVFLPWIGTELASQYTAGVIILGAAPCTAMVFVWSYLTDGDPAYTLVQVAVNDLLMLVLFAPIVGLLIGVSGLAVPVGVLITSVVIFIVIPLAVGVIVRTAAVQWKGRDWFETAFLPRFQPVAITALLATLVLIFAFQADNILSNPLHVVFIAVPLLVQVYFIWSLTYSIMWFLKVPYSIAAPGSLIGASNFFELAVATAIALYGPDSGAALATVVGVLVEVPVMLSVCAACRHTRPWFSTVGSSGRRLHGDPTSLAT